MTKMNGQKVIGLGIEIIDIECVLLSFSVKNLSAQNG